jgi:hypothetical protein
MKTSPTIMLALTALMIGTVAVTPVSSIALAGGGGPDKWCGAPVCSQQTPPFIGRPYQTTPHIGGRS